MRCVSGCRLEVQRASFSNKELALSVLYKYKGAHINLEVDDWSLIRASDSRSVSATE